MLPIIPVPSKSKLELNYSELKIPEIPYMPLIKTKHPKTIKLEDISSDIKDIIIGSALGDLHIRRRATNTCLNFKQSYINKDYILHLYSIFEEFCKTPPRSYNQALNGNVYTSIVFDTLTYPAFNFYHETFYKDKKKVVPLNINELLTARGLAY